MILSLLATGKAGFGSRRGEGGFRLGVASLEGAAMRFPRGSERRLSGC